MEYKTEDIIGLYKLKNLFTESKQREAEIIIQEILLSEEESLCQEKRSIANLVETETSKLSRHEIEFEKTIECINAKFSIPLFKDKPESIQSVKKLVQKYEQMITQNISLFPIKTADQTQVQGDNKDQEDWNEHLIIENKKNILDTQHETITDLQHKIFEISSDPLSDQQSNCSNNNFFSCCIIHKVLVLLCTPQTDPETQC